MTTPTLPAHRRHSIRQLLAKLGLNLNEKPSRLLMRTTPVPAEWARLLELEPRVLLSGAAPTIGFVNEPYAINEGGSIMLDASGTTDFEGDPLTFAWDINGDGSFGEVVGEMPTVSWATLNAFGIDDSGSFPIGLQVNDGTSTVTEMTTLTVNNVAPTIAVSGDATVNEGSMYSLTLGAVTDPGNDTASVFIVDWGDGTDPTAYFSNGVKTHVFEADGAFTINVTVVDDDGAHMGAGSQNVTVNNMAPSAINGTTETLAAINEDTAANDIPGATVNTLFLSHYSDAADDFAGVAIVANAANSGTEGDWQFSTDGGTNWTNIGTGIDATTAVILEPTDKLRFNPAADFNGTPGDLSARLWDGGGGFSAGTGQDITGSIGGNGSFSNGTPMTLSTSINAINDAPVFDSAAVTAATEDGAYTYNIMTSDADGDPITITDLALPSWLSLVDNTDGTATLSGTPTNDDTGLHNVVIQAMDNNTTSTTQDFMVNVAAVNDAPVLSAIEGTNIAYTENDSATAITSSLSIADIDDTNIDSAVVQITGNYQNGMDVLAFVDQNGITGSFDSGTGALTLSGSAALADYQAAIRSVTYANTSESPDESTRTLSITVNDGDDNSNTLTRDIDVTSVNDLPTLTSIEGSVLTFAVGASPIVVTSTTTVGDVDDTNIESADVQISAGYVNGEDVLAFVDQNGITGSWDAGSGTMSLSGSATLANYEAALQSITFENTSGTPTGGTRTVSFTVNDGDGNSNTATRNVNINFAPTVTEGAAGSFTEDGGAVAVDSTIVLDDQDSSNLVGATIQITSNLETGVDVLAFVDQNGITGSWDSGSGTMTLSGIATVANYQTAIRSITFNNASQDPEDSDRTVSVTVDDGESTSSTLALTVSVAKVNDDPVNTVPGGQNVDEDSTLTFSSGGGNAISIADVDAGGSDVEVTLTVTQGTVSLSGVSGLAFTAGDGTADATMTFTGTVSDINTALDGLTYTPNANYHGADTLTLDVDDQGNTGSGGNLTDSDVVNITVGPIADDASVTGATTDEDTQSTSGLVISRNGNDGAEVTHFKITNIVDGTLFQNDGTTQINDGDFITFAEGNAGLKFTPSSDFHGSATFDIQASTSNMDGGLGGSPVTATVTVTPIADNPSITAATTDEDVQSTSGLVVSRNANDSTEVTHIKVTNITNGTLFQNDGTTQINDGDFITVAEAEAGLKFTPTGDFHGSGTFDIQASTSNMDPGLGGSTVGATVTVTPIGDTPSVTDATTDEDTQSTTGLVISRNGADGAEVTHFKITNITNGSLFLNDGTTPVNDGDSITFAQGNAGLKFTPDSNSFASGTFDVQSATDGADGGLSSGSDTATITVNAIADTPSITDTTTDEDTQSTDGLVVSRNAADGAEVTHFKVMNITGGTLFQNDGTTQIMDNDFITFAQANAGLKFTPTADSITAGSFDIQASTQNMDPGLGGSVVSATINITPIADTPTITDATTDEDTQSTAGLAVTKNGADGAEVTHVKVTNITNGSLFLNDGTTAVSEGEFVAFADAAAGFKFTPDTNFHGSGSFDVQASTSADDSGLGGSTDGATITVDPIADTPSVTDATTDEDTQSTSGLVISKNAADGAEVTHLKITGITNGTLFQNDGTTQIMNGDFITAAEGAAGLKFTPTADFHGNGTFDIQASTQNMDAGLGGSVVTATVTVDPIADDPSITGATTDEDTQSTTGLVVSRNVNDSAEVTHFQITNITNGSLFQNDGTTPIANSEFITFAQANAGLKFTPDADFNGAAGFDVQASTNSDVSGLGGSPVSATVTVNAVNDDPVLTVPASATTDEDTTFTFTGGDTISIADVDVASDPVEVTLTATNGTVSLSGTTGLSFTAGDGTADAAMTFTGTLANVNAALANATFDPTADFSGAASLQVDVDDQGNNGSGGNLTDSETINITVTGVNDQPMLTVPGAQNVDEDTALTFTGGTAITLVDTDATTVQLTLTATQGTLTLGGTTNLSFSAGDGTADTTMTFTGAPSDINTALDGMTFDANADYNGAATVQIDADDLGSSGTGGNMTDSATVNVTVDPVNDDPVNTIPGAQTVDEDNSLVINGVSIADLDAGTDPVEVALTVTNGTVTLGGTGGLSFTAGDGTADAAMTFTGTVADINTALTGLTFDPDADFHGAASVQVDTDDQGNNGSGGNLTDSDTINITVDPVADTPQVSDTTTVEDTQSSTNLVITPNANDGAEVTHFQITNILNGSLFQNDGTTPINNGDFITAAEGAAGLTFTPDANSNTAGTFDVSASLSNMVSGVGGSAQGATVTITPVGDTPTVADITTDEDTLSDPIVIGRHIADGAEVTHFKVTNITGGTLFQNGGATAVGDGQFITFAEGQAGLQFMPDPDSNTPGSFDVESSEDGSTVAAQSGVATSTITVTPVGDTPTVNDITVLEDAQSNVITMAPNANDGAEVTHFEITNITGGLLFQADGTTPINDGDFITLAQGTAGVKFTPTANSNTAGTFDVAASEDGATTAAQSSTATSTVTITPVGDTPQVADIATNEDTQSGGIVIDRNADDGAEVTHFHITNITGGTLFQNDGTTQINNGDYITFAQGQAGVKFTPSADSTSDGSFDVESSEDGTTVAAQSGVATSTITVVAQNDAPVNTVPGGQTVDEDTALTFSGTVSIADADASTDPVEVTLTATDGTLSLSGTTGLTFSAGDGTDDATMTFTGTVADINTALNGMTYTGNADFNGAATVTIMTDDQGNNGAGGSQTDTDVINITVDPVNDAPVNTAPTSVSTDEDTTFAFTGGDAVSVADVDEGGSGLQVTLAATNGTVTLGGTTGLSFTAGDGTDDATMTFTGSVADINTALAGLAFDPTAEFTGAATVTLTTDDQGATGSGGSQMDVDVINITVDAVNDQPMVTVPGAQNFDEDTTLTLSTGGSNLISVADLDANPDEIQVVVTATNGDLTLAGTTNLTFSVGDGTNDTTMTFTGTVADINTALDGLVFTPTADYAGAATIQVDVDDMGHNGTGGSMTDSQTVNITVDAVNDAPVNTVPGSQTVNEDTNLPLAGFSIADIDADTNDVEVTLTATNGTVTLGGTTGLSFTAGDGTADATMTFTGTVGDINTALGGLGFDPTADFHGAATVQIQIDDQGNVGSGGSMTDDDTVNITVDPIADTPQADNGTATEDTLSTVITLDRNANDGVEVTHFQITNITDGTLFFNGGATAVNEGDFITVGQGQAGLQFLPAMDSEGPGSFDVQAALDGAGAGISSAATSTITVTPVNDDPTFTSTAPTSTDEDAAFTYNITTNDPDSNDPGSDLTITDTVVPGWLSFTDNGDGTATLTGTPTNDEVGDHMITLTVADDTTGSSTQMFTLTVNNTNDDPTFTSSPVTAATEDAAYSYNIGTTDVDADDPSGDLSIIATQMPSWLTLIDNGNGTGVLLGVPGNGDVGNNDVTLEVQDDNGGSTQQMFTIAVGNVNDDPTITSSPVTSVDEDATYTYNIVGNDIDADDPGSDLDFTLVAGPSWLGLTDNNDGTATLTGTPDNDDVGDHAVTISITDDNAGTTQQMFTVTVNNTNDDPVLSASPGSSVNEDSPYSFVASATDVDADDPLSDLTFSVVSGPAWLTVNNHGDGSATFSGTPNNNDVGTDNVTIKVTDDNGGEDTLTFSLTVNNVNDDPTIDTGSIANGTEDAAYSQTINASDVDDSGSDLTFTPVAVPSWLTLTDNGDGSATLTGTPTNSDVGPHTVSIQVSDDGGGVDTATYNITVSNTNDAPEFGTEPVTAGTEDAPYTYDITASDVDADDPSSDLSFAGVTVPGWLTLTDHGNGTATLAGTPGDNDTGDNAVVIEVSDDNGGTTQQSFTIAVVNVNDAPTITSEAPTSADEDSVFTYTITTNDPDGDNLTITAPGLPAWLTITDHGDGTATIEGTPENGDVGDHPINVVATDPDSATDQQMFTVSVANTNDDPFFASNPNLTAFEDSFYSSTFSFDDVDADDPASDLSIVADTLPGWLGFTDNGDGTATLSGTPTNGDVGANTIGFTISDDNGGMTSQQFDLFVNNTNDAPFVLQSINDQGAIEGQLFNFAVPGGTFLDVDAEDTLTLSATLAGGGSLPGWLNFSPASQTFSGTPGTGDVGTISVAVTATDGSAASATDTFDIDVVDITPPTTPAAPQLDAASDSGPSDSDGVTNNNTPTFTGLAEAGSIVRLFANGVEVGSGEAVFGSYSITTSPLADGDYSVTVTATDASNNTSDESSASSLTIDTTSPFAPSAPAMDAADDSGASNSDGVTNDSQPRFTGTALVGSTVALFANGVQVGSVEATDGTYDITPETPLADGSYNITAVSTDLAGNVGDASSATPITIDTAAPAQPSQPDLAAISDTGDSDTDNVTADNTLTLGGSAEAGSSVTLFIDGAELATVDATDGTWEFTTDELADGTYAFTTTATDTAGNTGPASAALNVTIDTSQTVNLTGQVTKVTLPTAIVTGNGGNGMVQVQVANDGNVPVDAGSNIDITIKLQSLTDSSETTLVTMTNKPISNLQPGATRTFSQNVSLPNDLNADEYAIIAMIDSGDAIDESGEQDNTATADQTLTVSDAFVDLETEIFKNTLATAVVTGESAKGQVTVRMYNRGNTKSPTGAEVTAQIIARPIGGGEDIVLAESTRLFSNVQPDTFRTWTTMVTLPDTAAMGEYELIVNVDPGTAFEDGDAANNTATADEPIVVADPFVDLTTELTKVTVDDVVVAGQTHRVIVQGKIHNDGNTKVDLGQKVDVQVVAQPIGGGDDVVVGTWSQLVSNLQPGKTRSFFKNFTLPTDMDPGDYQIVVNTDVNNAVTESDETNNAATDLNPFAVELPTVDLLGSIQDVTLPTDWTFGESERGRVKFQVTNNGNVKVDPGTKVDIQIVARPEFDGGDVELLTLNNIPLGNLQPGKSRTYNRLVTTPDSLLPGDYRIAVIIDAAGVVDDANPGNNDVTSGDVFTVA